MPVRDRAGSRFVPCRTKIGDGANPICFTTGTGDRLRVGESARGGCLGLAVDGIMLNNDVGDVIFQRGCRL